MFDVAWLYISKERKIGGQSITSCKNGQISSRLCFRYNALF